MMRFIVNEMDADELKDYVRAFNNVRDAYEDLRFAKDHLIESLAQVAACVPRERNASMDYQRRKYDLIMMEQHLIEKYRSKVDPELTAIPVCGDVERSRL